MMEIGMMAVEFPTAEKALRAWAAAEAAIRARPLSDNATINVVRFGNANEGPPENVGRFLGLTGDVATIDLVSKLPEFAPARDADLPPELREQLLARFQNRAALANETGVSHGVESWRERGARIDVATGEARPA